MKKLKIRPAFGIFVMLIFLMLVAIAPVAASDSIAEVPTDLVAVGADNVAMFRGDPQHTGVYSTGGINPGNTVLWRTPVVNPSGDPIVYNPTASTRMVFVGNLSGSLSAVDADTGDLVWLRNGNYDGNEPWITERNSHATPLGTQGSVYYPYNIQHNQQRLVIREALTGIQKGQSWNFGSEYNDAVYSSPVLIDVPSGRVAFGTYPDRTSSGSAGSHVGEIVTVAPGEAEVQSIFSAEAAIYATPAYDDGRLYFGDEAGNMYAIDATKKNTAPFWKRNVSRHRIGWVTISGNKVYGVTHETSMSHVFALDKQSGDIIWDQFLNDIDSNPTVTEKFVYIFKESSPSEKRLCAIHADNGTLLWEKPIRNIGDTPRSSFANGILYVTSNNELIAFDGNNGDEKGRLQVSGSIVSSPTIDNGRIYFTTADGYLYAVGTQKPQPPVIEWQKSFGGGNNDYAEYIIKSSDGGAVIGGETRSFDGDINKVQFHGIEDIVIAKFNSDSTLNWSRLYGGTNGESTLRHILTLDDGYLLIGTTSANDGDFENAGHHGTGDNDDIVVVKIDQNDGHILWSNCYGGSGNDVGMSSAMTNDNSSAVIVGFSDSKNGDFTGINKGGTDAFAMTIDLKSGALTKVRMYGGSLDDEATQIQIVPGESDFVISGFSDSNNFDVAEKNHGSANGTSDGWVFFIDKNLNLDPQRNQLYGGSDDEEFWGLKVAKDGNLLVIGNAYSKASDGDIPIEKYGLANSSDVWMLKLDKASGSKIANHCYGGSKDDFGHGVRESGGGYFLLASTKSNDGDVTSNHGPAGTVDLWLMKTDLDFRTLYQKTYGGSKDDYGNRLGTQFSPLSMQNGYLIGTSWSNDKDVTNNHGGGDIWILKLRATPGESLW